MLSTKIIIALLEVLDHHFFHWNGIIPIINILNKLSDIYDILLQDEFICPRLWISVWS